MSSPPLGEGTLQAIYGNCLIQRFGIPTWPPKKWLEMLDGLSDDTSIPIEEFMDREFAEVLIPEAIYNTLYIWF